MAGRQCCVSWYHYWDLRKTFPDVTPIADHLFVGADAIAAPDAALPEFARTGAENQLRGVA